MDVFAGANGDKRRAARVELLLQSASPNTFSRGWDRLATMAQGFTLGVALAGRRG